MFKFGEVWKKDLSLLVYSAVLWGVVLHFLFKYGVADKSLACVYRILCASIHFIGSRLCGKGYQNR